MIRRGKIMDSSLRYTVQGLIEDGLFIMLVSKRGPVAAVYIAKEDCVRNMLTGTLAALRTFVGRDLTYNGLILKAIGDAQSLRALRSAAQQEGVEIDRLVSIRGSTQIAFLPKDGRLRFSSEPIEITNPGIVLEKTRVLIVDDSATIRALLQRIFSADADIEVVGATGQPSEVYNLINTAKPNVITMDIRMPEMDGVTLLKSILPYKPVPTLLFSSLQIDDFSLVIDGLEAGAVDYIHKPSFAEIEESAAIIIDKVKNAKTARVHLPTPNAADNTAPYVSNEPLDLNKIIAIGASTGGTEALKQILIRMPPEIPPILIVQHIPATFSKALAERLNSICPFEVKEARHGDVVCSNRVLIAPGGTQMRLKNEAGGGYTIEIDKDAPTVNRHKPSVDVLFNSVAAFAPNSIGVILTGMGGDGANGLLAMKNAGAHTIAQNEETCVVFGMPKEAIKRGATVEVLPITSIASGMLNAARVSASKRSA